MKALNNPELISHLQQKMMISVSERYAFLRAVGCEDQFLHNLTLEGSASNAAVEIANRMDIHLSQVRVEILTTNMINAPYPNWMMKE